jgi:hypothetical protein
MAAVTRAEQSCVTGHVRLGPGEVFEVGQQYVTPLLVKALVEPMQAAPLQAGEAATPIALQPAMTSRTATKYATVCCMGLRIFPAKSSVRQSQTAVRQ